MEDTLLEIPVDPSVLGALRAWRQEEARQRGVPAYWIITNRTIAELAARLPLTLEDLTRVNGMGEARVDRYGEPILEIIREHAGRGRTDEESEPARSTRPLRVSFSLPDEKREEIAHILGMTSRKNFPRIEVTLAFD